MRMKMEGVEVDDPRKAMNRFKSALAQIVRAPKTVFKSKHKHTTGRAKKTPKR
jgi:hypothetical protein